MSVTYYALQGADSCHTYVRDAETEGDQELLEFFREAEQQSEQLAERAKSLLAPRLGQGGGPSLRRARERHDATDERMDDGMRIHPQPPCP